MCLNRNIHMSNANVWTESQGDETGKEVTMKLSHHNWLLMSTNIMTHNIVEAHYCVIGLEKGIS